MNRFAYVGSYSPPDGTGQGITVFAVDHLTGKILNPIQVVECPSAAFMCLNRDRSRLYVVNELNESKGQVGTVSSFRVDSGTGKLTFLNSQSAQGYQPCHLTLDPSEKYVLVANYGTGSVLVFPVSDDGSLEPSSQLVQHAGETGPNAERQEAPHAHQVHFDVKGKSVLVPDLGRDRVVFYHFDGRKLSLDPEKACQVNPGAGPRHVVDSTDGRFIYVINELISSVSVFDAENPSDEGELCHVQTESTLPVPSETSFSACAELVLHPNGKFLYGSNRGDDSIVIFSVDGQTGQLVLVGHQKTLGKCPRHFTIASDGGQLYVANQLSDNIVTFHIDLSTGKLSPSGDVVKVESPVCIVFA